jgi:hypothetical protein
LLWNVNSPASFPANIVSDHVSLTYQQQASPLPLGMPEFELVLVLGQPISFAIVSQAIEHYLPSTLVDFTGGPVANHMGLLEMAEALRHQKLPLLSR